MPSPPRLRRCYEVLLQCCGKIQDPGQGKGSLYDLLLDLQWYGNPNWEVMPGAKAELARWLEENLKVVMGWGSKVGVEKQAAQELDETSSLFESMIVCCRDSINIYIYHIHLFWIQRSSKKPTTNDVAFPIAPVGDRMLSSQRLTSRSHVKVGAWQGQTVRWCHDVVIFLRLWWRSLDITWMKTSGFGHSPLRSRQKRGVSWVSQVLRKKPSAFSRCWFKRF